MGWNYRVFKEKSNGYDHYTIREVYYYENGKPNGYTANAIKPEFFDEYEDEDSAPMESLKWQLEKMLEALEKPILTNKDFKSNEKTS